MTRARTVPATKEEAHRSLPHSFTMNYCCGEYSYVQLTVDQVFEGIKKFETNLNSEPKTRPKENDARFIDNIDLGQLDFVYNRKYKQYFIFSDNKNEEVNPSTKYNHVMDLLGHHRRWYYYVYSRWLVHRCVVKGIHFVNKCSNNLS